MWQRTNTNGTWDKSAVVAIYIHGLIQLPIPKWWSLMDEDQRMKALEFEKVKAIDQIAKELGIIRLILIEINEKR